VSLSGTFATMPFPDLMQWLGDQKRSGTLTVALAFEERYLRLEEGMVTSLGSDDPRARDLARLLLGRGLIDEPRLRRALREEERSRRPLRTVIIDDGHVPAPAVSAAVRAYAKDIAVQLFLWHDGKFFFTDEKGALGDVVPTAGLVIDPPIPVRELLMDGVRRLDEWHRIAEVLPSDFAVVHALGQADDLPSFALLQRSGEPIALGDLVLRAGRARVEVLEELYEAWRRGVLAVDAVPQQLVAKDRSSPTSMLVGSARALLEEKQFDEAAALLRSALDLDPYNDEARGMLHRARSEQLEDLYTQFPPVRIPVAQPAPRPVFDALSARERYVLTRVDGVRDVAALTVVTPLGELETLRVLKKFVQVGIVKI
jgi:hypothetical protein